jgi:hypothetical protein
VLSGVGGQLRKPKVAFSPTGWFGRAGQWIASGVAFGSQPPLASDRFSVRHDVG